VGSIFLGIDVVLGPGQRFKAESLKAQLQNLQRTRDFVKDMIRRLPSPPWTPAEMQGQLDDEDRKWAAQEAALKQKLDRFSGTLARYENRIASMGMLGTVLLVLAFLLQAVALYRNAQVVKPVTNPESVDFKATAEHRLLGPECLGPFESGKTTGAELLPRIAQIAAKINAATAARETSASAQLPRGCVRSIVGNAA
jgi:hypothetical protein